MVKSIQHVTPQWVALGQTRMVEVVRGVVGHAQPLHDSTRADVGRDRERHDLFQADILEAETDSLAGRLRRLAVSPSLGR